MTTKKCLRTAGKASSRRIVDAAAEAQHDRPAAIERALRVILTAAFDGSAELARRGVTPRLRQCISSIEQHASTAVWVADYCLAERVQR
jgi:hypothetical protein